MELICDLCQFIQTLSASNVVLPTMTIISVIFHLIYYILLYSHYIIIDILYSNIIFCSTPIIIDIAAALTFHNLRVSDLRYDDIFQSFLNTSAIMIL